MSRSFFNIPIEPEIIDILSQCIVSSHVVVIPKSIGRLPLTKYTKVNTVLESLGGTWKKKEGGHFFPNGDAVGKMKSVTASGTWVDKKRGFQQLFTPTRIAEQMADLCGSLIGTSVLEPSAGYGNIADVARDRDAFVVVNDIDLECVEVLRSKGYDPYTVDFVRADPGIGPIEPFMGEGGFDIVLMNPPFSEGRDLEHVRHAFKYLIKFGTLVAIMSLSWMTAAGKRHLEFATWFREVGGEIIEMLPPGTFKESGTQVATVLIRIQKQ